MTKQAKKRRQKKRKQARKATVTTPAPALVFARTLALLDHLPDGWAAHLEQAIAWVNAELSAVGYSLGLRRDDEALARCDDLMPPIAGVQVCLGTCGPGAVACAYGLPNERFEPYAGRIIVTEGYAPNPGVLCHELMHVFGVMHEDGEWEGERPCPFAAGLIRR